MKKTITISLVLSGSLLVSCSDFLLKEPQSSLSPDVYLTNEANIASYVIDGYENLNFHAVGKQTYGTFADETHTDNFAGASPSNKYTLDRFLVPQSGGTWDFERIYRCNYFLERVPEALESGEISGNVANIKHYIGEMYFLRAYVYFDKLKTVGDFPILQKTYPDEMEILTYISKRAPRNEVARFILSDLDKAIELMNESAARGAKNALIRDVAYMLKARAGLCEGTWLKYFKGTAF